MDKTPLFVIGGFGFNYKILNILDQLNLQINFIDINLFPATYDLSHMAMHLSKQLTYPINLLAYSCGGLLALQLYRDHPNIINKLILLNSTPKFIAQDNWAGITQSDFAAILNKCNTLNHTKLMHYLSKLYAYPYSLPNEINSYWSNTSTPQLVNWLKIIYTSDLRGNYLFNQHILWLNSANDNLIKLNPDYINPSIINQSSHLLINNQRLLAYVNEFICKK